VCVNNYDCARTFPADVISVPIMMEMDTGDYERTSLFLLKIEIARVIKARRNRDEIICMPSNDAVSVISIANVNAMYSRSRPRIVILKNLRVGLPHAAGKLGSRWYLTK